MNVSLEEGFVAAKYLSRDTQGLSNLSTVYNLSPVISFISSMLTPCLEVGFISQRTLVTTYCVQNNCLRNDFRLIKSIQLSSEYLK